MRRDQSYNLAEKVLSSWFIKNSVAALLQDLEGLLIFPQSVEHISLLKYISPFHLAHELQCLLEVLRFDQSCQSGLLSPGLLLCAYNLQDYPSFKLLLMILTLVSVVEDRLMLQTLLCLVQLLVEVSNDDLLFLLSHI